MQTLVIVRSFSELLVHCMKILSEQSYGNIAPLLPPKTVHVLKRIRGHAWIESLSAPFLVLSNNATFMAST